MKQFTSEKYIGRDKIIGLRRLENVHRQEIHTHDFIELVYIDDGSVCETIDGTDYRVKRGDLLFIHYNGQHSFFSEEGFSHTEIFFSPRLVEDGTITPESALALLSLSAFDEMRREQRGGMVSFSGEQRREVEVLLSAMLREQQADLASSQTVLSHYLSILLTKMLRQSEMAESESVMRNVWQDLRLYIDENAQKPLTLASLAARCFYNPSYFSRAFKQKFGVSPHGVRPRPPAGDRPGAALRHRPLRGGNCRPCGIFGSRILLPRFCPGGKLHARRIPYKKKVKSPYTRVKESPCQRNLSVI